VELCLQAVKREWWFQARHVSIANDEKQCMGGRKRFLSGISDYEF